MNGSLHVNEEISALARRVSLGELSEAAARLSPKHGNQGVEPKTRDFGHSS